MSKPVSAGAGKAEIVLDDSLMPVSGFTSVHDPLHIRALLLKGDVEILILSVEITSLFPDVENRLYEIACELTGLPRENVWLTLTHSFGGPHMWPDSDKDAPKDAPGAGAFLKTEEDRQKNTALKEAHYAAVKAAVQQAVDTLQPAVIGYGAGTCSLNASRNIETPKGWSIGTNFEEPCDHSVPVLSIKGTDGKQLAFLFEYGVRSCVLTGVTDPDGGNYVSADLAGDACTRLEDEYREDQAVALFLCGACGDQEPALKGCCDEQDKDGNTRQVNLGAGTFTLLEAQGRALASEVLQINRRIESWDAAPAIKTGKKTFICQTKARQGRPEPGVRTEFIPSGEKTLSVDALLVDDFNLVGVQPEINGMTSVQIAEAFPDECTMVAVQVNGGDKCMPDQDAYDTYKFQSQNSNVMPGSAEVLRDTAISLVRTLRA